MIYSFSSFSVLIILEEPLFILLNCSCEKDLLLLKNIFKDLKISHNTI